MSFDNNRSNHELQRDYYSDGDIAAGAKIARGREPEARLASVGESCRLSN